jgi:hypothetical protein
MSVWQRDSTKIFILDDNKDRMEKLIEYAKKESPDSEILIAYSADEAYKILSKNKKLYAIFLDHDLGDRIFVDSSDQNTGYQVAKYIKDKKIEYEFCIIHTMNPVGAQNIFAALDGDASIVPVSCFINGAGREYY